MAEQVEWKQIDGFENYEVSNDGRVRNKRRGREKKPNKYNKGYSVVWLNRSGERTIHRVHRLVASAFVSNPENKPQVDHIDNDRTNNHYKNLRFASNQENGFNQRKNKVRCIEQIQRRESRREAQ